MEDGTNISILGEGRGAGPLGEEAPPFGGKNNL
jgi:hypothetical protein